MTQELPPIILKGKQLRKFRHIKNKYPVSSAFLHSNYENWKRFILYALNPHCVLRRYAWRKRAHRVIIVQRIRHLLFDPRLKRMIKRRRRNVKQWSQRTVSYYKKMGRIEQYEETELYDVPPVVSQLGAEELSKQMKQQLELLKSGKRGLSLIEDANKNVQVHQTAALAAEQPEPAIDLVEDTSADELPQLKISMPATRPAIDVIAVSADETAESATSDTDDLVICESAESSPSKDLKAEEEQLKTSRGATFLDMLFNKVRVKTFAKESNILQRYADASSCAAHPPSGRATTTTPPTTDLNKSPDDDSGDDFLGFDESGHQPGMLLTPLVPQSCKTLEGNSAFVSHSLDAYMLENNIQQTPAKPQQYKDKVFEPKALDGLVTPMSTPPRMDMPAVPESLQKLRTVAERRQYLQRFSKNHKMAIINNEANIFRELLRKQRNLKVKSSSMMLLQGPNTQMPFTREGWRAASYVATEHNKYYYQVMKIDGEEVKLPGALGNNASREKRAHSSKLSPLELSQLHCTPDCMDAAVMRDLKVLKTKEHKAKLNQFPLPAIFRPCPLSQKPYQKPLDDDTAALLLAGGSMAVVSMPTVTLDVEPQLGRPLDDIAKRYLQHILPHHDITREWAEFSVSTLQQPSSMRDAEAEAAKTTAGRRKSFTFVIPYLNDRNHILVRRVVDRSEQLDSTFNEERCKLQEFQFRSQLLTTGPEDDDQVICADMLSDMINTVAISCSENSFIQADPDGLDALTGGAHSADAASKAEDAVKLDASKPKANQKTGKQQWSKQHRLRLELRRLNATIIDAAAKSDKANKPCSIDFCQLGCVCESLASALPMREHCGKAACVLECSCKLAQKTRVVRVETDGRGISNEDAFNLRRQATARLAKMEKEFTSTLVLTDNETLLINESQCDKKRRCTKAPKRYEDFADGEEDQPRISPPKREVKSNSGKRRVVNIESTNASAGSTSYACLSPLSEPCLVRDTDMMKLQHCYVALRRLPDVSNLATFCMTHHLYKCFCGGESIEGKPLVIEKEQANTTTAHLGPEVATRAHYSFERPPEETPKPAKQRKSEQQHQVAAASTVKQSITAAAAAAVSAVKQELQLAAKAAPEAAAASAAAKLKMVVDADVFFSYYKAHPTLCRRAVPVPRKSYLRLNRRRVHGIRQRAAVDESAPSQQLLNIRITNAIRFYRAELDQQRRQELKRLQEREQPVPPVIEVRDDSDESTEQPIAKKRNSTGVDSQTKRLKLNTEPPSAAVPVSVVEPAPSADCVPEVDIQVPRIAACYSLNSASLGAVNLAPSTASTAVEVLGSDSLSSVQAHSGNSDASNSNSVSQDPDFRSFYNDVVKNMNALVSKKMQDIDLALQRESKIIPTPNEEILCIIQWANFLAAFDSSYVFIWDVKMKNYNFLAATITNMMPSVCGAIGVVNVRFALDRSSLPLMARMLMEGNCSEATRRLAVVMQGRQHYWLVKGFLRHTASNACTKPTPQTHPLLTKKINVLCSLLVKQRMREHQRKTGAAPVTAAEVVTGAQAAPAPAEEVPNAGSDTATLPKPTQPAIGKSGKSAASHTTPIYILPKSAVPAVTVARTPAAATTTAGAPLPVVKVTSLAAAAAAAPTSALPTVPLPTMKPARSLTLPSKAQATPPAKATPPARDPQAVLNIRSNIEFRKVCHTDVNELQIPELHHNDHRWVVLDLFEDFSHIFVPAFKDMISLDRIHNVMRVAIEKHKVVKLQFFQDAPYDAFVTPSSRRKIYFGPLRLDMSPPVLVLLQSVDGKMMLREVYQREHNIVVESEKRSRAFWVLHINGQVHFEIEMDGAGEEVVPHKALQIVQLMPQAAKVVPPSNAEDDDDDDDDDCIIIEDDDEGQQQQTPMPTPAPTPTTTADSSQRLSFTIQTTPASGALKITSISPQLPLLPYSQVKSGAVLPDAPPKEVTISSGSLTDFSPFLVNMPAAKQLKSPPPAATSSPVSHFITPQVQLTQTALTADHCSSSAAVADTPPPAKISRISVHSSSKLNESLQQLLSNNGTLPTTNTPKSGVTITKIPVKSATPALPVTESAAKTLTKPGMSMKRTACGTVKQSAPAASSSPAGPNVVKQKSTTISIANLPPHLINMRPVAAATNVLARQSLPASSQNNTKAQAAPKASQQSRRSEPNKNAVSTAAPHLLCYGHFVADGLPQFRSKKLGDEYIIKMGDSGVLRVKCINSANVILNKQMASNLKYKNFLPGQWKFVPSEPIRTNVTAVDSTATTPLSKNNNNGKKVVSAVVPGNEHAIIIED